MNEIIKTKKEKKLNPTWEQVQIDTAETVSEMAEQYLKDNPITHPLGEYCRIMYVQAFMLGLSID